MNLLRDKICVIAGGAGSIGLETAKLFLANGARVQLVDIAPCDIGDLAGPTVTIASAWCAPT